MKNRPQLCLLLVLFTASSAVEGSHHRDKCTVEAIEKAAGRGSLEVTLLVPDNYTRAVEISNGGILVLQVGCPTVLNAIFSEETAERVIEEAPVNTLSHHKASIRAVTASLYIWEFLDNTGETRFFVLNVNDMRPILKGRTRHEEIYYVEPGDGS